MFKILIAEDDRELRQLFAHVLTKNGYTVLGVSNGEEALDALGVTVRYAPVALWEMALVRHDPAALAAALRDLYREASPTRIYG